MPLPTPYPYEQWAHTTRRQVGRKWQVEQLRWTPDTGIHTASRVLGTAVSVAAVADWHVASRGPGGLLSIRLTNTSMGFTGALTLSTVLARQLADRVLGGPGDILDVQIPGPQSPFVTGVLAYLAARVLPPLTPDFVLEQVQITTEFDEPADLARELQINIDGQIRHATFQITMPRRERTNHLPSFLLAPPSVRALPVTLVAEVGSAWLTLGEVRTLQIGDTLVPDHCQLTRRSGNRGEWTGSAQARISGSDRGYYRCTVQGENLMWMGSCVRRDPDLKKVMAMNLPTPRVKRAISADEHTDPVAVNGDAPIQVTLELARFTLPLDTLASLGEGDILQTGSAIGSHVTLCASGVAVATGELVSVDGEVGVCIRRVKTGRDNDTSK